MCDSTFNKRERGEGKFQIYFSNLMLVVSKFTVHLKGEKVVNNTLIHQWMLIALRT